MLRTALALSLVTGTPFRMVNIRAGRRKPGLLRQHLAAVRAAGRIGQTQPQGADLGSTELTFVPHGIAAGTYRFAVGSAGSATLVLQAVLPALLTAPQPSTLTLEGGTHNPFAPPFDFLANSFLPLINRMGPGVEARLERPGFYPAGGGCFLVTVEPVARLRGLQLLERGDLRRRRASIMLCNLPRHIGERERAVLQQELGWPADCFTLEAVTASPGPGNVVSIEIESAEITEVFTAFGRRGVRAETVADEAVHQVRRYLDAEVPVGEHLADQLLLPLALAGGGAFKTLPPSIHAQTNAEVLRQFLDVSVLFHQETPAVWHVTVA